MNPPAICNSCGNASPAWDQLCEACSKEISCENCHKTYKQGQGLQEVNLCSTCLNDAFESPEEEETHSDVADGQMLDPYEEFGFDYSWEL